VVALPLMTLLLVGLMFKIISLRFDRRRKELTWSRRGLFERAGGAVPFDAIRGMQVQSMTHSGRTSYRVVLVTADGEIPLTASYGHGEDEACRRVAEQIDDFLTLPPLEAAEQNALAKRMAAHRASKASTSVAGPASEP
jgi:hypothetical protein